MVRPLRVLSVLLGGFLLLLLAFGTRHAWLPWIGEGLVRNDGPAKADIAVVLAGDYDGHRIELAANLVKNGYVPLALVDGPAGPYGTEEADLAINFIVKEGYSPAWFAPLPMDAHSTAEEARIVIAELERRHTGSFLLVTSDYHTARAGRTFQKELARRHDRMTMRVVAANDHFFNPGRWWENRESRKITLLEWTKTVAAVFNL